MYERQYKESKINILFDDKCTKKIKSYASHCDVNEVDYNKDTCKESGSEDQAGVISDHCCIRSNVDQMFVDGIYNY